MVLSTPGTLTKHEIASAIGTLLGRPYQLILPYAWFKSIRNHTAIVLLGDILSSYQTKVIGTGLRSNDHWRMDGKEILLSYGELAKKLRVSSRSVSRAIDFLVRLKAVSRSRQDRKINGKITRNIVGVIPNMAVISKLSGLDPDDILSAPELSEFQQLMVRRFAEDFEEIVGHAYKPTASQRVTDLRAVATLKIPKGRHRGRNYIVQARQYLAAKVAAAREEGDTKDAAFDRFGHTLQEYTLEEFVRCAQNKGLWPPASRRPQPSSNIFDSSAQV